MTHSQVLSESKASCGELSRYGNGDNDECRHSKKEFKKGELPILALLPALKLPPRIMTKNAHLSEEPEFVIVNIWTAPNAVEIVKGVPGTLGWNHKFDMDCFSKMLSKIAYCIAVARLGSGGFDPLVLDYILGKHAFGWDWFIGNTAIQRPPEVAPADRWHHVRMFPCLFAGWLLLVVRICLFGHINSPTYDVIVGSMNAAQGRQFIP
jgi:hypothetical protein